MQIAVERSLSYFSYDVSFRDQTLTDRVSVEANVEAPFWSLKKMTRQKKTYHQSTISPFTVEASQGNLILGHLKHSQTYGLPNLCFANAHWLSAKRRESRKAECWLSGNHGKRENDEIHENLLVSPVSRKSPCIHFGFKKVKLERDADNSGREFWACIFGVA